MGSQTASVVAQVGSPEGNTAADLTETLAVTCLKTGNRLEVEVLSVRGFKQVSDPIHS